MSRRLIPSVLAALTLLVAVVALPEPAAAQPVFRIAGADRYETAALISGQFAPGVPAVFIASGENYPDAIAAGWVSGALAIPVLLVRRDSIPAVTQTELLRLAPINVFVLGGTAAVSDAVVAQLVQPGVAVIRLAGADRYGTAAEIVNFFGGVNPLATVLVASGTDFPDAMVAGAVGGAYGGMPLLLVPGSGPLPPSVVTALSTLAGTAITSVVIMGSPAEVSAGVEAALANPAPGVGFTVLRVPGNTPYERSVAVWLPVPLGPPVDPVITTGENWPDGLAGALFVGQAQAAGITPNPNVMVLTRTACVPGVVAAALAISGASRFTILGGPSAVSPAVEAGTVCT